MSELMAEEWEKWLAQEKANQEAIEKELDALSTDFEDPAGFRYREFWAKTKEIAETLKTTSPLPEVERERLEDRFQRICRDTKRRQSEEWESIVAKSRKRREQIEHNIDEARSWAEDSPDNIDILSKAQSQLSEVLSWLKEENSAGTNENESQDSTAEAARLLREDRQACWDKWREANDLVFGRREAIWNANYPPLEAQSQAALSEANEGDPFHALDMVKEAQSQMKKTAISRTQRQELRTMLNSAWETAIAKVNEIRDEKKRKYEDWLNRMEGNIERWTEELQQNSDQSAQLTQEVEQIKEEIQTTAKARDYMDSLREQLAEKRQKIQELDRTNRQLEEKIQSAKDRIGN